MTHPVETRPSNAHRVGAWVGQKLRIMLDAMIYAFTAVIVMRWMGVVVIVIVP